MFHSDKEAISALCGVHESLLKKVQFSSGLENDGMYCFGNRVYKISSKRREFLASKRLIGHKFKNVVNIYSAHECKILSNNDSVWDSYIIEQEKLYKNINTPRFDKLDLDVFATNVNKNMHYFIGVMRGISELASVGIIHKDLHSLNIMSDKNNNPKIIDFGIVVLKRNFEPINCFPTIGVK
jgi:serine/threonine protein kinase